MSTSGQHTHSIPRAVGRGALAPGDTEAQALVVANEAGGVPLPASAGGRGLDAEGQAAAAAPLAGEVVVLGPQRRGGDGVLRLHHALPQHRHGDGHARTPQGLHGLVVLRPVQVDAVYLRERRGRGGGVHS